MGNRHDGPIAALRWASFSTTAVTLFLQVCFICVCEYIFFAMILHINLTLIMHILLIFLLSKVLIVVCCSVCDSGHMYISADGYSPRLDIFLLFRGHLHVLLCPLADVCFWNAALWHVSALGSWLWWGHH